MVFILYKNSILFFISFILAVSTLPVVIGTTLDICQSYYSFRSHRKQIAFKSAKAGSPQKERFQWITKFLTSCSLLNTTRQLFKLHPNTISNDNHHHHHHQFAFINGVRVLGSLIVLVSHIVTIFPLYGRVKVGESPIFGYPDVLQNITGKQLIGQPFFNGGLFVQTFFTVSGMLLSYSALLPNSRTIPFFPYIWLRAARYLPPLIGTVCLTLAAELYFTSGSCFFQTQLLRPFSEKCLGGGWWRNLLFISNFSNLNDQVNK